MIVIMQNTLEIADLQNMKVNATKVRKVQRNFVLRKNGGHRPSSLGSRSIIVLSE